MEIQTGNWQVLDDSSGTHVGYWLSQKVNGKYYDWFAVKPNQTMPTPLDMKDHKLKYEQSDNIWYNGSGSWSVSKWEDECSDWLDNKFGAGNWSKENKYEATESSR